MKLRLVILFILCVASNSQAQWEAYPLPVFGDRIPSTHQSYSFTSLGRYLFCSSDTGIYISEDSGVTWTARNNGLVNLKITALGSCGHVLFAGSTSDFYQSSDTGRSWQLLFSAYSSIFQSQVKRIVTHGQYVYAVNDRLGVFRSSDSGATWGDVDLGLTTKNALSICANDSFVFVGTTDGVFRSSDNGSHWNTVPQKLSTNSVTALATKDRNVYSGCYLTDKGNLFFSSTSNGDSWIGSIYGISESSYFSEINDVLLIDSLIIISPIFSSRDSYLEFSTDNGNRWYRLDSSNFGSAGPKSPNSLFLFGGFLFATKGGVVARRGISSLPTQASVLETKNEITRNGYPNPTTSIINFNFSTNSPITALIINQLGQEVAKGHLDGLESSFAWNSGNNPSGQYYCIVNSKKGQQVIPFTVQH